MHVLVYWESENSYSVVNKKRRVTGLDNDDIIGQTLPVKWGEELVNGKIINFGSKKDMKSEETTLVQLAIDLSFEQHEFEENDECVEGMSINDVEVVEARKLRKKRRNVLSAEKITAETKRSKIIANVLKNENLDLDPDNGKLIVENNVANTNPSEPKTDNFVLADEIVDESGDPLAVDFVSLLEEKNKEIRNLEMQLAKSEKQNRAYRKLLKYRGTDTSDAVDAEMEDIGHEVQVSKAFMDSLRLTYRTRPSLFFKQLVFESGMFTLSEIANSSLNGKWENRATSGRPALNASKLQAAKEATISGCGLKDRSWEMAEFEKKIKTTCTDARKKLRRESSKLTSNA